MGANMSIDPLDYAAGVCEEFAYGSVKVDKDKQQISVVVEDAYVITLMDAMARLDFRRARPPAKLGKTTALVFQQLELSGV